jgi:hypothetical protein
MMPAAKCDFPRTFYGFTPEALGNVGTVVGEKPQSRGATMRFSAAGRSGPGLPF